MKGLGPRIRRHPRSVRAAPEAREAEANLAARGGLAVEAIRVAQWVQAAEANHAALAAVAAASSVEAGEVSGAADAFAISA